ATTEAIVGPQAHLTVGGDLFVQADAIERNSTFGRGTVDVSGSVSLAGGISLETGQTTASIDGKAEVTGNVNVTAKQRKVPIQTNQLFLLPTFVTGVAAQANVGTPNSDDLVEDLKLAGGRLIQAGRRKLFRALQKWYNEKEPDPPKIRQVNRFSFQGAVAV